MSKFPELYQYCQSLEPKISRADITKRTLELTNTTVRAVKSGLDINVCRGFFLSAANKENRLVQQFDTNLIVTARSLNYCWERFVYTKELMHLFDLDGELTSTAESFEKLLRDFGQPVLELSPQLSAENRAFWMALSCFCPDKHRLEFKAQIEKGHIDNYSIALKLRIPEQYVPNLFIPQYPGIIAFLTGKV